MAKNEPKRPPMILNPKDRSITLHGSSPPKSSNQSNNGQHSVRPGQGPEMEMAPTEGWVAPVEFLKSIPREHAEQMIQSKAKVDTFKSNTIQQLSQQKKELEKKVALLEKRIANLQEANDQLREMNGIQQSNTEHFQNELEEQQKDYTLLYENFQKTKEKLASAMGANKRWEAQYNKKAGEVEKAKKRLQKENENTQFVRLDVSGKIAELLKQRNIALGAAVFCGLIALILFFVALLK
jgi:hypothetical protein